MNTTVLFPRRAALHAVSPRSRRFLLDALEVAPSVSCSEAALLSGLNEKTVRNACRLLAREGILDGRSFGAGGETGAHAIRIAEYPSLFVLELGREHTLLRLGNTLLDSVFAVMRDASGYSSREEDLGWIFHQARSILNSGVPALKSPIRPAHPVVLYEGREPSSRRLEQICGGFASLGVDQPILTLSAAEAMAAELIYLPETRGASLVLCVSTRPYFSAHLVTRDHDGKCFSPLPSSERLQSFLSAGMLYGGASDTPEARVTELLRRVQGILPVDCVILEMHVPSERFAVCREALPRAAVFHTRFVDLNTPSLAHRGALRLSRRRLWESMTES